MAWSKSEINEIKVELKSHLPDKAERLSQRLGRAKINVKEKMKEIEVKESLRSMVQR